MLSASGEIERVPQKKALQLTFWEPCFLQQKRASEQRAFNLAEIVFSRTWGVSVFSDFSLSNLSR